MKEARQEAVSTPSVEMFSECESEKNAECQNGVASSLKSGSEFESSNSSHLRVIGAKTHNLKNVNVDVPLNKTTVITGPSGSGKSSLAFDTIFVEGQRQYMESLPTYSRQFLRRLTRPDVVGVSGLQPTIALDQRPADPNPLSLVATVTEIFDFLRILYARVGVAHCYKCGRPIQRQSVEEIQQIIESLPEGSRFMLLAPIVREKLGAHRDVFRRLLKGGFTRARVDGLIVDLDSPPELNPKVEHSIEVVVDRLVLREGIEKRLYESLQTTLKNGEGLVCCLYEKERQKTFQGTTRSVWKEMLFSSHYSCPKCSVSYVELEPRTFSFNSPYGACRSCHGIGKVAAFDPELLISNADVSLENGALALGKTLSLTTQRKLNALLTKFQKIEPQKFTAPLSTWDEETKRLFFFGTDVHKDEDDAAFDDNEVESFQVNKEHSFQLAETDEPLDSNVDNGTDDEQDSDNSSIFDSAGESDWEQQEDEAEDVALKVVNSADKNSAPSEEVEPEGFFQGLAPMLEQVCAETKSDREREYLASFRGLVVCSECGGTRIRREARTVTVGDKTLPEVLKMTVSEAEDWFGQLRFDDLKSSIAEPLVEQIIRRLATMKSLKLEYLTLDRPAETLSGGELQRVRLTTALGNTLSGVCYILDEPTVGLHPRDVDRLLGVVDALRERNNSVILVEHNEKAIRYSDWMIDVGPGAGSTGGEIVAVGTPRQIEEQGVSPTGQYLCGKKSIKIPSKRRKASKTRSLTLEGVQTNNLKDISVSFPLGLFTCVTGVSGSGKSSLVNDTLAPALQKRLRNTVSTSDCEWKLKSIRGASRIDKLVVVDQSPLGRSPRSNPATYSGVFDEIRKIFSHSQEAKYRGYKAGRFSFNIAGGRCEACQGLGYHRIESSILPDMYVTCPECEGKRFNRTTLEVKYHGKSIADVLDMSFDEAAEFFANHSAVTRYIKSFQEVGLGYLQLGQSATSLSGGEAQRIKLATELASVSTGNTLYVLDEPTVGLHPLDVENLLSVLNRLVDLGNTVVVIEHSLDVMKVADWIIDLGPEGGVNGGQILAAGTPEDIAKISDNATGQCLKEILFHS